MGERMRQHLRAELKLTPEEEAKISPIIDKAAAELEQVRKETRRRVHDIFARAHREMSANLTDEQRAKLQRIERRHRHLRRFHERRESPVESPTP